MSEQSSLSAWLTSPLAIIIGAVMVSGSILYAGHGGGTAVINPGDQQAIVGDDTTVTIDNPDDLLQADDPVMGSDNAKVTIVEFSDFQCPYCGAFWSDTYSQIKSTYIDTGKVRLVFRDYPLPFHEAAKPSALAANCAFEQGKFWEFHDKVFGAQAELTEAKLKVWAQQLGLDSGKFDQCLDSGKYAAEVEQDIADGTKFGVSGTPSFFINGTLLVGAQPFSAFQAAIDAALE